MLIPQFSLRWVLGVTAACGVLSLVAAMALRGSAWAMSLTIAAASVAATLLAHGAMFFVVWLFSLVIAIWPRRAPSAPASPFNAER
jgi:cytochrome bd-type quinol oxidase subunit 2